MRLSAAAISLAWSRLSPGRPKSAWFSALVASSASARPAGVTLARTTLLSWGDICRVTRPRCSSLLIALVTAAG